MLLRASADELSGALSVLDDITELRRPHVAATFLADLPAADQADWVEDLWARLRAADSDAPAVCVLDQGVQWNHPLLNASIAASDVHVADPAWPTQPAPNRGHGTEMAGLALYGDFEAAISGTHPVHLQHRLESVKILPDQGRNEPDSYGALTARAVDRPEIAQPDRQRAFMLAITEHSAPSGAEPLRDAGRPTAWSATVDALAYGRAIDDRDPTFTYLDRDEPRHPRLLIISAGNIPTPDLSPLDDHLDRCDTEPVEDPAQAWNALTVGAYSARDDMVAAPGVFAGWVPMAPAENCLR